MFTINLRVRLQRCIAHISPKHPSPPPTIISPSPQLNLPFALPVPQPTFGALSLSTPSHDTTDLLDALHPPPPSPSLTYFTAPSSPLTEHTPRSSSMTRSQSSPPHHSSTDDYFPSPSTSNPLPDLTLFSDDLTPLEKIYLCSCSDASFHRVFISHALPGYLEDGQVTPAEAVAYVLPLLRRLAMDDDESVTEALASELVPIIWYFFTHCQIVADDSPTTSQDSEQQIFVNTFTPIMGTLLLSSNVIVARASRYAVVDILSRIRELDQSENAQSLTHIQGERDQARNPPLSIGTFTSQQRRMLEGEILHHVVIAMGRLESRREGDSDGGTCREGDFTEETSQLMERQEQPPEREVRHVREGDIGEDEANDEGDAETEEGEQAAIGRLSCMSMMAAITATSGGHLAEDTRSAFVTELERVGRDPIYWVRREASFALGALAKVVPVEVLRVSLLPLFEYLHKDSVWHVRHSALFALPVILSRLTPPQRRSLALSTVISLSTDDSPPVRSGVLEVLGEVLYTFHKDDGGPPEDLVRLFLGRREDRGVRDGQQAFQKEREKEAAARRKMEEPWRTLFGAAPGPPAPTPAELPETPLESFFNDSTRPLICAFNFPAVALTLGRERWKGEVRDAYLQLAENPAVKVRRTLAASLGEMAKVIGEEHARKDLVGIWRDAIKCEEEEVRTKAVECMEVFVEALGEGQLAVRSQVVQDLLEAWQIGQLKGWREREAAVKALVGLGKLIGMHSPTLLSDLLMKALEDAVACVRETAVSVLPHVWKLVQGWLTALGSNINNLSNSPIHRRRMTFIACQQQLILSGDEDTLAGMDRDKFWNRFSALSKDPILGVRIGLARLIGVVFDTFYKDCQPKSGVLRDIFRTLSHDRADEVRAYLPASGCQTYLQTATHSSLFSRPPPLSRPLEIKK